MIEKLKDTAYHAKKFEVVRDKINEMIDVMNKPTIEEKMIIGIWCRKCFRIRYPDKQQLILNGITICEICHSKLEK